jgi:hypothetical protein
MFSRVRTTSQYLKFQADVISNQPTTLRNRELSFRATCEWCHRSCVGETAWCPNDYTKREWVSRWRRFRKCDDGWRLVNLDLVLCDLTSNYKHQYLDYSVQFVNNFDENGFCAGCWLLGTSAGWFYLIVWVRFLLSYNFVLMLLNLFILWADSSPIDCNAYWSLALISSQMVCLLCMGYSHFTWRTRRPLESLKVADVSDLDCWLTIDTKVLR